VLIPAHQPCETSRHLPRPLDAGVLGPGSAAHPLALLLIGRHAFDLQDSLWKKGLLLTLQDIDTQAKLLHLTQFILYLFQT
jgi:hypothetical protein